jgi:AraC-like DNA-binding protein
MVNRNDLEFSINNLYKMKEDDKIIFRNEDLGKVNIVCRLANWYAITTCRFSNMVTGLTLGVTLSSPLIIMYFQLKGTAMFSSRDSHRVTEQLHSLNHLYDYNLRFHVSKDSEDEYLCIKIDPALLLEYLKQTGQDNPLVQFCEQKKPFITLHRPMQINPPIYRAIYDLLNCPYKGGLGTAYKENIVLNLLIHQLAAFTDNEKENQNRPGKLSKSDIDLLNNIREYLDEHFLEVGSLHQLTRKFCINSFKLKYGFKQLFSNPVMKYIDEHKMNYAHTLLRQGEIPVYDIADELGYEHYNNFSTAFKKRFGYSPAAIRN